MGWLIAAALCCASPSLAQQPGAPGLPPPAVIVERIEVRPVRNAARFTARVEAIEAVDVRARVTGYLRSLTFRDGQAVAAGDLLFEIEPNALEAALASARAQLARMQATRSSAERALGRSRELFSRNTVAQAALDDAQAAFDIASADVQAAEAAVTSAELNLSYTRILAPIAGQIGRAAITAGNLVSPDSGPLVRIVRLDEVRVAFAMSEGLLVTLRQQAASGGAFDPAALRLSLRLANGTDYAETGRVEFVENEVDPQTGTVTARALFANPHHVLIPGQFVTLSVEEREAPRLAVVPQRAVLQDREGRFVYLVGEGNTVSRRRIEVGARIDEGWAVTAGLSGGERVVVEGIQRLAEGMRVQPSEGRPVGGGS